MAKKVQKLKGFPEWLPERELVQQHLIALLRHQFELNGFTPLQLRSVERVDDLLEQGETDKEIYGLRRLAADAEDDKEAKLGLHYDLTVPFARYVQEHRGQLTFPFRRYQIQPAWRGERPQRGRYREFLQADIDIIGSGKLEVRHDGQMIRLLQDVMRALPIPRVRLLVNNRKVLEGFYRGLGVEHIHETLRAVDKLDKIGSEGVARELRIAGLDDQQSKRCLELAGLEATTSAELDRIRDLGVTHDLLAEGLTELGIVLDACASDGGVVAAMRIARGFDYYTGTVVEGVFAEGDAPSVCSGGRYDNLASGSGQPLPGMGVSIGLTRIMGLLEDHLTQDRKTPAHVVVIVHEDERRAESEAVAAALRARDIPCLVSDVTSAYGKQMKKASQLGVPYVWFPGDTHEVKCIVTGEQASASLDDWRPDPEHTRLKLGAP
jgi:histidyl-tRNA synthetase